MSIFVPNQMQRKITVQNDEKHRTKNVPNSTKTEIGNVFPQVFIAIASQKQSHQFRVHEMHLVSLFGSTSQ